MSADRAYKTIYLTGAPAAGKSTLSRRLSEHVRPLEIWEYGAKLTEALKSRSAGIHYQTQLRARSAQIVTPADIDALDEELITWVERNRRLSHLVIDSHPVTKEDYGFRITAFESSRLRQFAPDEIWVLYVPPQVAIDRITIDAAGRPSITAEQSQLHTFLQASVAGTYGVIVGCPVYLFDASGDADDLARLLARRFTG